MCGFQPNSAASIIGTGLTTNVTSDGILQVQKTYVYQSSCTGQNKTYIANYSST